MKAFAPTWAVMGLLAAGAPAAAQVAVPSLYNTGVGVSGGLLLPEGSADSHYTLIAVPPGSSFGPDPHVAVSTQTPIGSGGWIANGPSSQWIMPGTGIGGEFPAGHYTYRTTFDLTGFDPASTSVLLRVAADDHVKVYLNDAPTGLAQSQYAPFAFGEWHSITHGFHPGLNTFDFVVTTVGGNDDLAGSTGLRVEMSGHAVPVPEPVGIGLVAVGTLALTRVRAHRRKSRTARQTCP